jgi:uroporphyrinogen decarboxylase
VNHLERFYATVERREVDYPASWLGMPTEDAMPNLLKYFKAKDLRDLKLRLGDDVWPVDVPYHHPPANHVACAFDFAKSAGSDYEERTLTAPGFFEGIEDCGEVGKFKWPNPKEHMDARECAKAVAAIPDDYAALGVMWSAHFQDACAAFGMENALMTMLSAPEMFDAVISRIVRFYLEANAIFYEAGAKRLDAVLIGNDLGSQTGLMLSPDLIRRFVLPGTKLLVDQAKSYGFKVMHHSCGGVREIIPDLIDIGVDVIHPIQVLAAGMEPAGLKHDFGHRVSFCGGMDVQHLLTKGPPEQVREEVVRLRKLFPTGLIFSPSHEALMPDVPPANVAAMFDECKRQ